MNSRERIQAAINHLPSDRVPLDLGGTLCTGIQAGAYARLRAGLGLPARPPQVIDAYMMLAEVDDDVRDALGVDTVPLRLPRSRFGFRNEGWRPWQLPDGTDVLVPAGFAVTRAENGDLLLHPHGNPTYPPSARMPRDGYYFDAIIRQEPLDESRLDPEEWARDAFAVYGEEDLRWFERESRRLHDETERSLIINFGGGAFGDVSVVAAMGTPYPKGIHDPLEWYVAHRTHPEYIRGIFEIQCQVALQNLALLWQAVGSRADVVYVSGADFGTQDRPFISPGLFRQLYKPFHKRLNDWIHEHTTWKAMYHSCGTLVDLLDDLVDSGVDIINPVQCSARGMDPAYLKGKYGERLVFWGGGVDTQRTLPFGTPEEVAAEVRERIRVFSPGGGYVFNPVHNVQQKVPVENLLAMFRAVRESWPA